ncbi:PREDICTED: solute carrier family 25 member 45 isoform X2 [Nicrophorus vespilloides]|uniref:Solute carrier family 25 member 45 isoform X2 n=1 Tax=Nicrophorus vespilloides TaxID=110193 RepID=A0ABM1MYJ3_NICVS|nr:PREDICTED: solute carrier family 25 member 45 isoform X2 [Nicrophorus vespilloides]
MNWQDFSAGWIGGVAGLVVGHPLDTMKVRQQTLGSSLWKAVQMTFVHEGPRAFFKGVLFPALMTGPSNAVFFGIYGNYMRIVQSQGDKEFFRVQKDDPEWMKHVFWGGCTAGFFQVVVTCPPELVKIILQCQTEHKGVWHIPHETHYHGVWDCVRKLFKKRGIPGLYKGVFPMMCRDVPTSGIYTLSYELLKIVNYPIEKLNHPLVKQVMAGGCAVLQSRGLGSFYERDGSGLRQSISSQRCYLRDVRISAGFLQHPLRCDHLGANRSSKPFSTNILQILLKYDFT